MRIAMVTQSYYPRLGGVTEHVHNLSAALRTMGHEVKVITSGPAQPGETSTIRIGRNALFPKNGAMVNVTIGVGLRRRLRQEFLGNGFDIIHIQCPLEPTLPLAALMAARAVPQRVVGTFHTAANWSAPYEVFRPLLVRYAGRLDARIAVSATARTFALRYFPGDYAVIPNGVDFARFATCTERAPELDDGRINLLFVGRLDARKRVPWLISAFRQAHARNPNLRLVIVGRGPTEAACRLVAHPLTGTSIIFKGALFPTELPKYYNSAHIFCSVPSGSESFGLVLLEAMAAAKPVVATAIDGYRGVVTDQVEGLLVAPGDTAGLVGAIERLARDRELREALGARGLRKASGFDWSRVATDVERLYATLLDGPASA
ncbi:MAG TPA: glycosyltransferase family 4 protein [bacterium]|nr:glycosyltransferase family 4 protein [bacterium]